MSTRSLVAGGAPPTFTIPNPTSGDIGSALVVGDGAGCSWGMPDGSGKYYSGEVTFAPATGTGTFNAGNWSATVVATAGGAKIITFRFAGATTSTDLGGSPSVLTANLQGDLSGDAGAVISGLAVVSQNPGNPRTCSVKINGTTLTLSRTDGVAFSNSTSEIIGFVASWLAAPP